MQTQIYIYDGVGEDNKKEYIYYEYFNIQITNSFFCLFKIFSFIFLRQNVRVTLGDCTRGEEVEGSNSTSALKLVDKNFILNKDLILRGYVTHEQEVQTDLDRNARQKKKEDR